MMKNERAVTFGELLLRLSPEKYLRLVQSDRYEATFGGAEANVAVNLARYGFKASFVTKLPEHELGQAALDCVRRYGVDTSAVVRGGERVGIYYLEKGIGAREQGDLRQETFFVRGSRAVRFRLGKNFRGQGVVSSDGVRIHGRHDDLRNVGGAGVFARHQFGAQMQEVLSDALLSTRRAALYRGHHALGVHVREIRHSQQYADYFRHGFD